MTVDDRPPLRIALFTEVFLPKTDGVVTSIARTLDELRERGHEVLVVAPSGAVPSYAGFPVYRVPAFALRPWYPELSVGLPVPSVARRVEAFEPDLVHAVSPIALAANGVVIANRLELPLVASYHTDLPKYAKDLGLKAFSKPGEKWLKWLHSQADVNLCPSEQTIADAQRLGFPRVGKWPGGVDTDLFCPERASDEMRERLTDGHPDAPLILSVGRVSKEKNLDSLAPVLDRLPGARIAFVGGGPHEDDLKELFAGRPAAFTGPLSGLELATAFASSDVFVFPSKTDTLGLVSLEAQSSGIPVVGARAGGIPATIADGESGFLVDPDDPDDVAGLLQQLIDDPMLCAAMGAEARENALQYSWEAATDVLVDAYWRAIRRRGHANRVEEKRRSGH